MGSQYLTKISVLHLLVFQTLPICIHSLQVVYSSTEKAGTIEKVAPPKQATPEKEEDDDFNIDDI